MSVLSLVGAGIFGLVVGWITYRTLRRAQDGAHIADLAAVVAAIGGGAVVNAQLSEPDLFAAYGIGLGVGFFSYLVVSLKLEGRQAVAGPGGFLGGDEPTAPGSTVDGAAPPERQSSSGFLGGGKTS
ncbi:hypothetical protein Slala03_50740 [Streptomyces lavendulae subsp. lavendulae]|uniref:hypothetical protein n=1 Tax=Streptomyces lavendulae TaxID=1914 RepID=UPI0024A278BF|nr:hypothetical protein [Streptomyces lavendulae]GLV85385.1 hypothetical protein Slala03_50740 [Streptomyces lavendulae subsp. lavendulae]